MVPTGFHVNDLIIEKFIFGFKVILSLLKYSIMNFTNKFLAGLILGAAAGAIVAAFMQTEKGKEILGDIKEAAGDAGDNIKTNWSSFEKELNSLLKKGKQFVDDLEKKARDAASSIK